MSLRLAYKPVCIKRMLNVLFLNEALLCITNWIMSLSVHKHKLGSSLGVKLLFTLHNKVVLLSTTVKPFFPVHHRLNGHSSNESKCMDGVFCFVILVRTGAMSQFFGSLCKIMLNSQLNSIKPWHELLTM